MYSFEVTIRRVERPFTKDVMESLKWLLRTLGVSEKVVEDNARMLMDIIEAGKRGEAVSSAGLKGDVGQSTVSYRLGRLCAIGLIRREGRKYVLRAGNMRRTIKEIRKDIERLFEEMEEVAREIDELMGLPRG